MKRIKELSKRISLYQEQGKPLKNGVSSKDPEKLAKQLLKLSEEELGEVEELLGKSLKPIINVIIGTGHKDNEEEKEREERVRAHLIKEGMLKIGRNNN